MGNTEVTEDFTEGWTQVTYKYNAYFQAPEQHGSQRNHWGFYSKNKQAKQHLKI